MGQSSDNPDTLQPNPFRKAWSLADTQALVTVDLESPFSGNNESQGRNYQAEHEWREQYHAHLDKMSCAITQHLLLLAQEGHLQMPPHTEAVDVSSLNILRKITENLPIKRREAEIFGSIFHGAIDRLLGSASAQGEGTGYSKTMVENLHAQIVDRVEKGNFKHFEVEAGLCQNSGERLNLVFDNWNVQAMRFNAESMKFEPLAHGDIKSPSLMHLQLPVPSGTLLIADWFEHPIFKKLVDKTTKHLPSLNSIPGLEQRTRTLIEKMGVATVFVGNSGPQILSDEEGIKVGLMSEDSRATPAGSVCTDLWWTTAVDKQVLIELIAQHIPTEQAIREVEDMIENQPSPITVVQVKPGTHHLYCAGSDDLFPTLFDREGVSLDCLETPMFIISPMELAPKPSKNGPRMG